MSALLCKIHHKIKKFFKISVIFCTAMHFWRPWGTLDTLNVCTTCASSSLCTVGVQVWCTMHSTYEPTRRVRMEYASCENVHCNCAHMCTYTARENLHCNCARRCTYIARDMCTVIALTGALCTYSVHCQRTYLYPITARALCTVNALNGLNCKIIDVCTYRVHYKFSVQYKCTAYFSNSVQYK